MRAVTLLCLALPSLAADTLPETTVLAERRTSADPTIALWSADDIRSFSPLSIDQLLATDPSFSLFRRQSSTFANPTASGISLRNTGATAASRSLVLLDGIPQNDPFGGWINWTRYPPSSLHSARIVSAAGSAVWGNLSPAGSIQLTSRDATANRSLLTLTGGSHGTIGAAAANTLVSDDGRLAAALDLAAFHSDGFRALPSWQRGAIDRRLDLDHAGAALRLRWQATDTLVIEPSISLYEEHRGNGTPLTENETEALDLSLRLTAEHPDQSTQLLTYYQDRRFSSVFTSVNADRSAETVALDQFHVPGQGLGGALVHRRHLLPQLALSAGTDFRLLTGETNEDAGTFRRRRAGGDQGFTGLFTTASWEITPTSRLDASARLDRWSFTDGSRIERSLTSSALLRQDLFPDRDGFEPSASLDILHDFETGLTARLSTGTSFRAPTLNELYRPFRVRNDLTEANALLDPERFYSIEAGLQWQPNDCLTLGADFYHHWIHDAIANVPITDPARIAAIFGTLPPGGTGARRQNVDQARVTGLQSDIEWRPDELWTLRLDALWSHTEFTSSESQPLLTGQPFPQTPDIRLTGTLGLQATECLGLFTGFDYAGSVYDDTLGQRRLPSYWTCRIGATWEVSESLSLHARVENLLDTEIPTGLASNGLRTIGQTRALWLSADWSF